VSRALRSCRRPPCHGRSRPASSGAAASAPVSRRALGTPSGFSTNLERSTCECRGFHSLEDVLEFYWALCVQSLPWLEPDML